MELEEVGSCDIRCEVSKMDSILLSVAVMNYGFDHVIYGLEGWKIPASERVEKQEEIINEDKLKSVLTERQYKRLHLYAVMNMTLEQIADMEHVSIQSVSRSIHAAKKKILKFLSKQGEKVPF